MEETFEVLPIVRDLAIVLIAAKGMGLVARKCKIPMVAGEIIAGLLIGPMLLGWVYPSDSIKLIAEIGVLLLMFEAGLDTDLKELVKTGPKALAIASAGVFIPLTLGTIMYMCIYGFSPLGSAEFYKALFIGCIMTATSVGITVEVLKELGKLKGRVGTTILSAAIIDDVIGIVVLTFVIGLSGSGANAAKPSEVVIKTVLFFAFAVVVGILLYHVFKLIDKRWPHTRRLPILGLALCFAFAYIAETFFGIADITGAFVAGIILCSIEDADYIYQKMDISSYMLFGPVFFVKIGLETDLSGVGSMIGLCVAFVIVSLVGKIIGCGFTAKVCKFTWPDSLKIGIGMMTRGEVALIVTNKGLSAGLIDATYYAPVILLIICSSILTPILLKILFQKQPEGNYEAMENKGQFSVFHSETIEEK